MEVLILIKLQAEACNFTKINSPPLVFFMFFKLYKWYQITQCTSFEHIQHKNLLLLQLINPFHATDLFLLCGSRKYDEYCPAAFEKECFRKVGVIV